MLIEMKPIGYIKSPYKNLKGIPRQSILSEDSAVIEILPQYKEGIEGIKENSFGVILFYFHKTTGEVPLKQTPYNSDEFTGVFSTRSPRRPNGIGMSIVKFIKVEEGKIEIQGVDMVDGTPVLDIKPYAPQLNPKVE
ncbi:tRNA (N6-threonylcarbamoyladenosine(37)-N6)-methyltransferase TrmO [Sporanaerobacter acetigenes]|uniref:tRNA-Thr(GGU) m(6)t(6)A37 methyltransferase TsaA n=1 Tax=Sporanaerobacter acetigenes DSM 13106 TaxID=1123281 RepID=A0A1M5WD96_9FIRM|nr:tRNA (N6-threonylcarbamoyladenosine(37)-N6)-methyltransferase TrmO [Sporanaerobacter acetigenes]SHH85183.1 tRNA-Thr(GGU) m(6)t(6)A37 methyltransferase TsaA [Sporanaerobacter acetigenes DSM 13106]